MYKGESPRVVVVIPARGGSKGVPRKNLEKVGGIPLVARAVLTASRSSLVSSVVVSSDCVDILSVAESFGAVAVERPESLSGDFASSESALHHAILEMRGRGLSFDIAVLMQCTSPFTSVADIDNLINALTCNDQFRSALTVSINHAFIWRRDEHGFGRGVNHDEGQQRKRRQDLGREFRETGSSYAVWTDDFMDAGNRFCAPVCLVETDAPVIDVDNFFDLRVAQAVCSFFPSLGEDAAKLANIKLLVTDFDGVHTDDFVYFNESGTESVRCSRKDGLGISRLKAIGIEVLILSKEQNPVVSARARKLGCEVIQGVENKREILAAWLKRNGHQFDSVAFLGNDMNDVPCMELCGFAFAPQDSNIFAKGAALRVLESKGGDGAVREVCELIISSLVNT